MLSAYSSEHAETVVSEISALFFERHLTLYFQRTATWYCKDLKSPSISKAFPSKYIENRSPKSYLANKDQKPLFLLSQSDAHFGFACPLFACPIRHQSKTAR